MSGDTLHERKVKEVAKALCLCAVWDALGDDKRGHNVMWIDAVIVEFWQRFVPAAEEALAKNKTLKLIRNLRRNTPPTSEKE